MALRAQRAWNLARVRAMSSSQAAGAAGGAGVAEAALEKLQQNPYYDKYAERITRLQQQDPAAFLQRAAPATPASSAKPSTPTTSAKPATTAPSVAVDTSRYSSVLNPKPKKPAVEGAVGDGGGAGGSAATNEKKLADIMKVELVQDCTAVELRALWEQYHRDKDVVAACIPVDLYDRMAATLREYPTFLLPLPREDGYEFMVMQANGPQVHFTSLLAYQVHGENAPECLTVMHYTELRRCGLVLMRGEYDPRALTGPEAACLAQQVQWYYAAEDGPRADLLRRFSREPDTFVHTDLLRQLELLPVSMSAAAATTAATQ